jgi:uncharacterized protein YbbK (DUF523 family)
MKIIVSACLLGENVRYDGNNCLINDPWLQSLIHDGHVISICPEVKAGMGIPRESVELQQGKVIGKSGKDYSPQFQPVFQYLDEITTDNNVVLAILKDKSPSCGVDYIYDGTFSGNVVPGKGVVAEFLDDQMPTYSEKELASAKMMWEQITKSHQSSN